MKLVSNFESYAAPKVTKLVQTLGNIANPRDQYKTSVAYLGNNAILTDLTTWRQPGKQVSDMSPKQLSSKEGRIKLRKYAHSPKFEAGESSQYCHYRQLANKSTINFPTFWQHSGPK